MLMLTASLLAPLMYLNRGCMAVHSYESHPQQVWHSGNFGVGKNGACLSFECVQHTSDHVKGEMAHREALRQSSPVRVVLDVSRHPIRCRHIRTCISRVIKEFGVIPSCLRQSLDPIRQISATMPTSRLHKDLLEKWKLWKMTFQAPSIFKFHSFPQSLPIKKKPREECT